MAELFRRAAGEEGPEITAICSREEAEVLLDYFRESEPHMGAHPALAWRLALEQALDMVPIVRLPPPAQARPGE